MHFGAIAKRALQLTVDHSPTILTALGAVGTVTATYLAARASFEARDIIRLKEAEDEVAGIPTPEPRDLLRQRVELTWKLYVPAAATCVASVACIISAAHVSSRRLATVAALYSIVDKSSEEYKQHVIEKIGERKEESIRDAIAQKRVENNYNPGCEIYGAETGELCYDKFSDRFFRSTIEDIRSAQNTLNHMLLQEGTALLSDLYSILELPIPAYAYEIGWNHDRLLEIQFSTTLAPGDKPCLSIEFKHDPGPDFNRFR